MALLPNTPFTSIEDFRVAVDAPVSTDLMTDIAIDLNNLRSILTDGATAVENIVANIITMESGQVNGNFNVDGVFSTGVFFSSEQFLWLMSL